MHPSAVDVEVLESGPAGDLATPPELAASPVVVRLAGLSTKALEPLASPSGLALLQARAPLEQELAEARRSMVERIGEALPGFQAAARRFLLAVKRSCFNGREIETYRGKPEWADLLRVAPDLAERIADLEGELRDHDRRFLPLYQRELARERLHVAKLAEDPRFLRGVAVARPGLVGKVRGRAVTLTTAGLRQEPEKWEQSLLRFVTRAAVKFSANSTLTAYALGSVDPSPGATGFRFLAPPRREVSLVRANRPEIEQLEALLLRHPAVRERSLVAWNDSLEETEPGRYRFLRRAAWDLDPQAERFHFAAQARVKVTLGAGLLEAARDLLRAGPVRYDTLLELLAKRCETSAAEAPSPPARDGLDQLVDLGALLLLPPWLAYETRLEQGIRKLLRSLPGEPALRATVEALDDLLALEAGFASAPRPEEVVDGMKNAVSRALDSVLSLAGHPGPVTTHPHFYEDVFLEPSTDPAHGGIFQIAAPVVHEIQQVAGLIVRFAGLFNHRHDVLHTLAAWWREHEPGRREAPFLEVAQAFAPVWKQFVPFHKTAEESTFSTFDPLHTEALAQLRERRCAFLGRYEELLGTSPAQDFLRVQQLMELVETLPRRYAPQLGASAFVQPVDAHGSSWVFNNLYEGTGRYLSRVTPVMGEPLQRRFLAHLVERSAVVVDDEAADLLEVKYPWGHLVRAHPPQTAKVLDLRGLYLDLPRERRVGLGDLTIQADLEAETFRLIDASGRRVLPVHLSTLSDALLPNLLRLLLAFGPGEIRNVFPFSSSAGDQRLKVFNRLTCGRLVLRRRSWTVDVQALRRQLATRTGARSYAAIHDWRCRLGLPAVGFYHEPIRHGYPGQVKPQYVDFSSPSLCCLFASSLRKMTAPRVMLEEALPSPTDFPLDAAMERRGFELLIDSLAVRAAGANRAAGVPDHDRESISPRKERQHVEA